MTRKESFDQRVIDLALRLGLDPAIVFETKIVQGIYNLGLETAAEALSGPGGNNDYLYSGSPEAGYVRQQHMAAEIRNLKI